MLTDLESSRLSCIYSGVIQIFNYNTYKIYRSVKVYEIIIIIITIVFINNCK